MPGSTNEPSLVHIGFHKTGTTWLQTGLFCTAPFHLGWTSMTIADTIVQTHTLDWSTDAVRAELSRRVLPAPLPGGVQVMSWERLSGSPHAGGYDSALIAERLHALYPKARILIGVREQRSMIEALYRQYVRDGGVATLDGYLRPRNPSEMPQFRFDHLAYDRLAAHYIGLFGADRVLVLPYEMLHHEPATFLERICRFCGLEGRLQPVEPNPYPGLRPTTTLLKRRANKVMVRNSLSPGARLYVKDHEAKFDRLNAWLPRGNDDRIRRRWTELIRQCAVGRYEENNVRLAALINEDLMRLGYAFPDHD